MPSIPSAIRRHWKILCAIGTPAVIIFISRETGTFDYNNYTSESTAIVMAHTATLAGENIDYTKVDASIPLSIMDYIPLYKSRHIKSALIIDGDLSKMQTGIRIDYDIAVTTKGVCSARNFRKIFSEKLLSEIEKTKPRSKNPA